MCATAAATHYSRPPLNILLLLLLLAAAAAAVKTIRTILKLNVGQWSQTTIKAFCKKHQDTLFSLRPPQCASSPTSKFPIVVCLVDCITTQQDSSLLLPLTLVHFRCCRRFLCLGTLYANLLYNAQMSHRLTIS